MYLRQMIDNGSIHYYARLHKMIEILVWDLLGTKVDQLWYINTSIKWKDLLVENRLSEMTPHILLIGSWLWSGLSLKMSRLWH